MKTIANRKWSVRDRQLAERIRAWLVARGGVEDAVTGEHETWRVRQSDAKWTYYTTGTLFVTDSDDPALLEAQREIDRLAGGRFVPASRNLLVGLDEAGKGEVFGSVVLAAAALPRTLFRQLEEIIGVADTKARHAPRYWEELFERIGFYRAQGLRWETAEIAPEEFDRISVNRLLDRDYARLLGRLIPDAEPSEVRIVLDDFGAGRQLRQELAQHGARGAEVVLATKADDHYLECRLAALVAKHQHQRALEAIRRDARYQIHGRELGSGNAGDPKTLAWLRAWSQSGRPWPPFVKRSFRTVREIDGRASERKRPSVDPE